MTRAYFDHAATVPLRPEALAAMLPLLAESYNASSLHAEGRAARAALDRARASVARSLGARPAEIAFTSGGTEGANLAVLGVARARRAALPAGARAHAVTVATEHRAVLAAFAELAAEGCEVDVLPVDAAGRVAPADVAAALRPGTLVVSAMLANNEIGTVAPVAEIAALAHARGVPLHCDAVQAPGALALDVAALGADLVSLAAHKFGGPAGTGVLYVRAGTALVPRALGGGQERGARAGTEAVAGAAGAARALELAVAEREAEAARVGGLRDAFERGVLARVPGTRVHAAGAPRLPGIASVAFAGVRAAELLISLDLAGFAASAGSACAAGALEPSHVVRALGVADAAGTLRFSLGRLSEREAVDRLLAVLPALVATHRYGSGDLGTRDTGSDVSRPEVFP